MWTRIGIDFIIDLLISEGYNGIMVMINAFIKIAHFEPVTLKEDNPRTKLNTINAAKLVQKRVFWQHRIPKLIVSDRDTHFLNSF